MKHKQTAGGRTGGTTLVQDLIDVLKLARAPAGNNGNRNRVGQFPDQLDIITPHSSVSVDRIQEYLPCTHLFHLFRIFNRIEPGVPSAGISVHNIFPKQVPLHIY